MTLVNRLKSTSKMGRRISCRVDTHTLTNTHKQTHTHTYIDTLSLYQTRCVYAKKYTLYFFSGGQSIRSIAKTYACL